MTGEVSEMIWVAAWGGQCWGHVPLFMSTGVSCPPPFPDPRHFLSSTGNLDGPLMTTLPSTFSSLPCQCMGCPGSGELPGDGVLRWGASSHRSTGPVDVLLTHGCGRLKQ